MPGEASAAEDFIYSTLHGDATLMGLVGDVWGVEAPQGSAYPFVVYQFMSGIDLMVVGAYRIWTNLVYLVKVVGQTANYADLSAAQARVDELLHRGSGPVADGTVWACVREQAFRLPEDVQGKPFRSAGGIYRLWTSSS